jgi:hypothetical protein
MTAADRERGTDKLIGESEALRAELLFEVEKLEHFVAALQVAVKQRREGQRSDAGDRKA